MSDKLRTLLVDLGMDNALAALDAEREAHAKEVETLRSIRDMSALELCHLNQEIADLRRRLADVDEAHATEIDDLLERIADLTAQLQDEVTT